MTKVTTHKPVDLDSPKAFIEHVHEIRVRLSWVALSIVVFSCIAYAFNEQLLQVIQKPINQTLYYTSPVGGLNFLIKLCVSVGIVISLPVIFYHLNKFIGPLIPKKRQSMILRYTLFSSIMAIAGVLFAYFISLPAALRFLTGFSGQNIESLIGVNEYYSFALAYIIGYALLFQLPIIILFINRIKPLKPIKMMRAQRWIILASFVTAAILTPTPDPINQLIMAAPAVIFYQFGVLLVWIINIRRKTHSAPVVSPTQTVVEVPKYNIQEFDELIKREIHKVFHEPIQSNFTRQSVKTPHIKPRQNTNRKAFDILPA